MIKHLASLLKTHHRQTSQNHHFTPLLKWDEALGCSLEDFRDYLQTFFAPGMSWENQGVWIMVRVRPAFRFDLTTLEGQKGFFHFSNVQPDWKERAKRFWKPGLQTLSEKSGLSEKELKVEVKRRKQIQRKARFVGCV